MGEKRRVFFLLIILFFFVGVAIFVMDRIGIVAMSDVLPFMADENPVRIEDRDFPSEVEKLNHAKKQEKLMEWQEALARKESELKTKEESLTQKIQENDELKDSLNQERKRLTQLMSIWNDRQAKVKDLSSKVRNMPPEKAREMMQDWTDFDIIDVLRQVDKDAELEGQASITPYLLTLFTPQCRAEITRKMLLPPLETDDSNAQADADNG